MERKPWYSLGVSLVGGLVTIGIHMGAFDSPTETHTELHIFVAEKGDYYEINDELPQ